MMRIMLAWLLTLSFGGLALALQEPTPGREQPQSRADWLKALRDEQARPTSEYRKALDSAKTDDEKKVASAFPQAGIMTHFM